MFYKTIYDLVLCVLVYIQACSLWCTFFTQHHVSELHLCWSTQLELIRFHCSVVVHKNMPPLVHPSSCWWTFALFPVWGCCDNTARKMLCWSPGGCVGISLGYIPRNGSLGSLGIPCLALPYNAKLFSTVVVPKTRLQLGKSSHSSPSFSTLGVDFISRMKKLY